ncbi:DNA polymerase III subunit delta' [Frigidibacter oleivorans]|uniref:DNA polymerase III subunit delta' n=1 Tax=Frigidibacter oleivorans TaxID=2487129 RepID=UPI000F8C5C90|nr:DNA polymerase III subunit delta' [Frigidibacter oleivorans]
MKAPRGAEAEPGPEPDRIEGVPHPRDTLHLFGQEAAEAAFLDAHATGRLHHGWMLTGPRGVGKATLAWRIARFLLATPEAEPDGLFGAPPPPATLDVPPDHPVARRMAAMAEPGLFLLRRGLDDRGSLRQQITVDEVRRMKSFFTLSAADGGRRVAIVDAADEMNVSAANALLKLLEEPPARTTLILIAHQPSRLLPTIRSRVRDLRLPPLPPAALAAALDQAGTPAPPEAAAAVAELAAGSVGAAVRLLALDGLALYAEIVALFSALPRLDRIRALQLADSAAGKAAEGRFDLLLTLFDLFLSRLARAGIMGPPAVEAAPGEAAVLMRLAPDPQAARVWAGEAAGIVARARQGRAVNLDPAALLMDMVLKVNETAAQATA